MAMLHGMDFLGRLLYAALLSRISVTAQHMTCGDIKHVYRSNTCCGDKQDMVVESPLARGVDPPIPGVLGGTSKAHVLLGMAPDYPPILHGPILPQLTCLASTKSLPTSWNQYVG